MWNILKKVALRLTDLRLEIQASSFKNGSGKDFENIIYHYEITYKRKLQNTVLKLILTNFCLYNTLTKPMQYMP